MKIAVIIPVFNEEENLSRLLPFINEYAGDFLHEVIVCDGGSSDQSEQVALKHNAVFLKCKQKGRSVQMNEGARKSSAEVLYFLHADTFPPKQFTNEIMNGIQQGYESGCFKMSFDSRHWLLRFSGWLTRFNNSWCRGGDQSLYVVKKHFDAIGGYDEKLVIYEDNEILKRLKKVCKFKVIQKQLITSARRYRENGTVRLQWIFFTIHLKYRFGVSHEKLIAYYKKHVR